jgi:TldD protein
VAENSAGKALATARSALLAPGNIADSDLVRALHALMRGGVDAADLYFQVSRHESWSLEDGIVKEGSHSIEQGVGVRAVAGEKTGFAYSDEILVPALMQSSQAASAIARSGQQGVVKGWNAPVARELYSVTDPIGTLSDDDKVALLQRVDRATRAIDPRVKQVMASIAGVHEIVMVCASDGTLSADIRPLVRMNVTVIVEDNGKRKQGHSGGGGRVPYQYFLDEDRALAYGREAVRLALVAL